MLKGYILETHLQIRQSLWIEVNNAPIWKGKIQLSLSIVYHEPEDHSNKTY